MAGRREATVRMSHELLASILKWDGRRRVLIEGMPEDAEILAVMDDPFMACYAFRVRSASFAEVPEMGMIPVIWLTATDTGDEFARLEEESAGLRGIFDDLRLDSPPLDAAYRQGLADAARLVEATGKGDPAYVSLGIGVRLLGDLLPETRDEG